ncbi:hypothetical protein CC1G_02427 [Coprinopsis cinerea okayama7|uniref:Uncharacterized protein n=1 Tax=Coprinopsis cinerea (strain Okayama-7 / 130 / ATCC MYA-4618 / FGSC 9003) TaxID=240176 RepID=A8NBG7_COPC7|nr:hypothetical protein CC1G_02427 [Coprinopsis cinerea okayama7\|eukprot:XP_001832165.2 hypothetical protein CC1G_02427 [Coprinopsis cinerea okayama7\
MRIPTLLCLVSSSIWTINAIPAPQPVESSGAIQPGPWHHATTQHESPAFTPTDSLVRRTGIALRPPWEIFCILTGGTPRPTHPALAVETSISSGDDYVAVQQTVPALPLDSPTPTSVSPFFAPTSQPESQRHPSPYPTRTSASPSSDSQDTTSRAQAFSTTAFTSTEPSSTSSQSNSPDESASSPAPSSDLTHSVSSSVDSPLQTDISEGDRKALEAEALSKAKRISYFKIVAIVIAAFALLALIIFFLVDPRTSRAFRHKRIEPKSSGSRPISSWFPFPTPPPPVRTRKPVKYEQQNFENMEKSSGNGPLPPPRSKFSVSSSEYSQRSRDSGGSTDTLLAENTRANVFIPPIRLDSPPVRPPRPPTADSPATIPDAIYFTPENQAYMDPSFDPSDCPMARDRPESTRTNTTSSDSPLLPPSLFFTMEENNPSSPSIIRRPLPSYGSVSSAPINRSSSSQLLDPNGGRLLTDDTPFHRERVNSAPMFMGNPFSDPDPQLLITDPVAIRVLQHRRSRSTSGWAYPKKKPDESYKPGVEEEESYRGVVGVAI